MPVPVSWCRGHSKSFLLITVLLLRYSAAGWPGLWPLRPYLDFGATGAPAFNLGVHWGFCTSPSPSSRYLHLLGLHWGRLRQLCPVWPYIQLSASFITFKKASILDFLTGEYRDDYGGEWDISALAVHPTAFRYFAGTVGARVDFIVPCWCGLPSQQVILIGEGTVIGGHQHLVCASHFCA